MQNRSIFDSPATKPFTLGAVMPSSFERYVRILEPGFSDELNNYVSWSRIAGKNNRIAHRLMQWEGITGTSEIQPADIPGLGLVHPILTGYVSSGVFSYLLESAFSKYLYDEVYACVWEGWANVDEPHGGVDFKYRNRDYIKYSVPLSGIDKFSLKFGPVSMLWPTDESWCVYNDIDTIDTFVGGSKAFVDAIKEIPEIETSDATVYQRFDVTSDQINIRNA